MVFVPVCVPPLVVPSYVPAAPRVVPAWLYKPGPVAPVNPVPAINYRFSKNSRLLSASQFRAVFQHGRRVNHPLLTIIQCQNNNNTARLGLAVSKKNVRHAVDRNRIKRIIREWFRHNQEKLTGRDVVVMAKPAAIRSSNQELQAALMLVNKETA